MAQSPAPSAPSGNRIPLYVALFVAVAALAILGLRLTSSAPPAARPAAQPAVEPASQQPFPSTVQSKEDPKPEPAPAPQGSGQRLVG